MSCQKCNCGHSHAPDNSCGCECHMYGHPHEETRHCGTTVVSADHNIEKIDHAEHVTINRSGPFYTVMDHFAIPSVGGMGVLKVLGEVLRPPSGFQVFLSADGYIAKLTITAVTRKFGDFDVPTTPCEQSCRTPKNTVGDVYTELTVTNDGDACNTLPGGAYIAQGDTVGFVAPDCSTANNPLLGDLFLCDKYHAPRVGESTTLEVSPNASTLNPGDLIQFGAYTVTVVEVTASTVTVRNDGLGGPEGAMLDGCDCASVRIFKVSGKDPCDPELEVSEADAIIVCDAGIQKNMCIEDGQVYMKENGRVIGKALDLPTRVISEFEGCITLDPTREGCDSYPLQVPDSSIFELYDTLVFTCDDSGRQFVITSISGNVLNVLPTFEVTNVETVGDGCATCKVEVVNSCGCLFDAAPECVSEDVPQCFAAGGGPMQADMTVTIPAGEIFGSFEYEDPECYVITNDKPWPVKACIDYKTDGFHNNITSLSDLTGPNVAPGESLANLIESRYVVALVDCESGDTLHSSGFSLGFGRRFLNGASFPASGDSQWHQAGDDGFATGNLQTCACFTLECSEERKVKLVYRFAYAKKFEGGHAAQEVMLSDLACLNGKVTIEKRFVNPGTIVKETQE